VRFHYCNTNYDVDPPLDINILLLQLYKDSKLLVLVSRENQKERLLDYLEECLIEHKNDITVAGWWELEEVDLIQQKKMNIHELFKYKAIIIISRDRIDPQFAPQLKAFEALKTNG
jgi:hypothetical protein